jgi:hypothetical protein
MWQLAPGSRIPVRGGNGQSLWRGLAIVLLIIITKAFERAAGAVGPLKKADLLAVPVIMLVKVE